MGAHLPVRAASPSLSASYVVMAHKIKPRSLIMIAILLKIVTLASGESDGEILLRFRESLEHNGKLSNWNASIPPCNDRDSNWNGVLCGNGNIWGLKLENMGLKGDINVDVLKDLPSLRSISLMNNDFDGRWPEFKKLTSLKTLYLSNNKFSGGIPSNAFEEMTSLKKLHMANNRFSGRIPSSVATAIKLVELTLEDNQFQGEIPDFKQERWTIFNLSNNKLEGPIPVSLSSVDVAAFSGNNLCGAPLPQCPTAAPGAAASGAGSGTPSAVNIVVIAAAVAAVLAAIIAVIIILNRCKQINQQENSSNIPEGHKKVASADLDKLEQGSVSPGHSSSDGSKREDQSVKLSFLRDDRTKFDMTDLLRASAEILGGGVFGSTYKAAMIDGPVMVVKRYRQMTNVDKLEFHEHMRRLGRLDHNNLLPLVAFYYRKEEKLLIFDNVDNGSLAAHLHADKSRREPSLDWPTRLKIIKGVGRGLMSLHNELPDVVAPHGHLKSSNVLLKASSSEPLLTDYGLIPIVNSLHARENIIAYKSPEFKQTGHLTNKTDVWSLGLLILETLTGKSPPNLVRQPKDRDNTDLTTWARSVVPKDDQLAAEEVLDKGMAGTKGCEGEIIKLLRIGLRCCEADVDKRWDMKEAVEKIEEVKDKDIDDDFYSSYTSEADMRSSRGLSDDFCNVQLIG